MVLTVHGTNGLGSFEVNNSYCATGAIAMTFAVDAP